MLPAQHFRQDCRDQADCDGQGCGLEQVPGSPEGHQLHWLHPESEQESGGEKLGLEEATTSPFVAFKLPNEMFCIFCFVIQNYK